MIKMKLLNRINNILDERLLKKYFTSIEKEDDEEIRERLKAEAYTTKALILLRKARYDSPHPVSSHISVFTAQRFLKKADKCYSNYLKLRLEKNQNP